MCSFQRACTRYLRQPHHLKLHTVSIRTLLRASTLYNEACPHYDHIQLSSPPIIASEATRQSPIYCCGTLKQWCSRVCAKLAQANSLPTALKASPTWLCNLLTNADHVIGIDGLPRRIGRARTEIINIVTLLSRRPNYLSMSAHFQYSPL